MLPINEKMTLTTDDFWRVNSYGYPNPFSDQPNSVQAWETFRVFGDYGSYSKLKEYWSNGQGPRYLAPHTVESWKAAFEEYGLISVLSGSDELKLTPAGMQFREAGESKRKLDLGWIGLNLLLRYPLRGPRRPRSPLFGESDLLLYWGFYAMLRELHNYVWWTEITHVMSKVFNVNEVEQAVNNIANLRASTIQLDVFPVPNDTRGAYYNSINQVIVHAGMYYLLLHKKTEESIYGTREPRISIQGEWQPFIDLALGNTATGGECLDQSQFISRIPKAPDFRGDEIAYFDYMGASVGPLHNRPDIDIPSMNTPAGSVSVMTVGTHYTRTSPTTIRGTISQLCRLSRNQRVILSDDLRNSYIIVDKARTGHNEITVTTRQARRITNPSVIQQYIRTNDD